jgi:hypothetical protein
MSLLIEFLDTLRSRGLEFAASRYYGKYIGRVDSNVDPQGQGRVKVECASATGRTTPLTQHAYPSAAFAGDDKGMFFPHDAGDSVWVWFAFGDRTIPRISGGWWTNNGSAKKPGTSQVPPEFRPDSAEDPIRRRGIKTYAGHILVFDDTEDEQRVELSTGATPRDSDGLSTGATEKHHFLEMTDKKDEEKVTLGSFAGHRSVWNDKAGEEYIEHKSVDGHLVRIDDKDDFIRLLTIGGFKVEVDEKNKIILASTPEGFSLKIDEDGEMIEATTKNGNTLTLSDADKKAEILTTDGRKALLDDENKLVSLEDPLGQSIKMSESGIDVNTPNDVNVTAGGNATIETDGDTTVTAGGKANVTAVDEMTLEAKGLSITSTDTEVKRINGSASETFNSSVTQKFLSTLKQTISGLWQAQAKTAKITATAIELGSTGTKWRLLTEQHYISNFLTHTHIATLLGSPTSAPVTGNIEIPGTTHTLVTKAG